MFQFEYSYKESWSEGPSVPDGVKFHMGIRNLKAINIESARKEASRLAKKIKRQWSRFAESPVSDSGFKKAIILKDGIAYENLSMFPG